MLTHEPLLSCEGLDNYLKQSEHYSGSGVVLALGVRGGVPTKAADVLPSRRGGRGVLNEVTRGWQNHIQSW